jgi:endonuclease III
MHEFIAPLLITTGGVVAVGFIVDWRVRRLARQMQRITTRTHAKTVSSLREAITGELLQEQLDAAIGRARTIAMVADANRRHGAANGNVAYIRGGN